LIKYPPLREPHHSASAVALTGGGHLAKPGEISLAHRGVLFLDELPEFPRKVLETLRQPLENGTITVARANAHVAYPARFQLIAAMNPCPCGYLGHPKTACTDTPKQVQSYKSRISGPLMDRIDLHVDVSPVAYADLASLTPGESSESLRQKVQQARQRQHDRLSARGLSLNAEVDGTLLDTLFKPSPEGLALLEKAANNYNLSARGWQRILRLSRTIADLAGRESIERGHIAEALSFRPQG
jgi:magnesium chelatase family protein